MIKTICAHFIIHGESYDPNSIEKKIGKKVFDSCISPGEEYQVGTRGPFRVANNGNAKISFKQNELKISEYSDFFSPKSETFLFVKNNFEKLFENAELDECSLHVAFYYDTQCNFQLNTDFLREVSELGIALTVSCSQNLEAF